MGTGSGRIDPWIANRQVVDGAVVIGVSSVIGHLNDSIEELLAGCPELFSGRLFRSWNGIDERVTIKRVHLIKHHHWNQQGVAQLGRRQRSSHSNYCIEIIWSRSGAQRLPKEMKVDGVARI